ncbi:sirohydrochlorin chelatase [Effusibacillus consociatus]|uniref:Sirohydrochlorin chelatase n=1 Tax=Effusibacillus consociatus TaxID=1117041 RepID=A0ABV9Q2H2_9BACL
MHGILLVGHGSLLKHATGGMYQLAEEIRQRQGIEVVEVAFLDLCPPDIPTGVLSCVKKGVTDLTVIPYFLSDGFLMRKAERIVKQEVEDYRGMTMRFGDPIGFDPRIVHVLKDRIKEAWADQEESK